MNRQKSSKRRYASRRRAQQKQSVAISPIQLSIAIILFAVLFVGGAIFLQMTSKSAYNITTRHDLQLFVDFQKFHFGMHGTCVGDQGQSLRNDGIDSTLPLSDYTLSKGVSITVIAGDPTAPYDKSNPYTLQAKHNHSETVFEYSFATGSIIER